MSNTKNSFITAELIFQFLEDFLKFTKVKKQEFVHPAFNKIEIEGGLACPKCKCEKYQRSRRWKNTKSLYYHILVDHRLDKDVPPSSDACIAWLRCISVSLSGGLLF